MATYGTFVDDVSLKASEANDFLSWVNFTPVLRQSVTVSTFTTGRIARYAQVNKLVIVQFYLLITGAGTPNNAIEMNLPVTASSSSIRVVGSAWFLDGSVSDVINCVPVLNSTTTFRFLANAGTSLTSYVGLTGAPSLTLASNDFFQGYLMYEAA
jgi:hypothetical protein